MLVLSRKLEESIYIGNDVLVTVLEIGRDRVKLGFVSESGVSIDRQEVRERPDYRGRTLPGKETP